MTLLVAALLVAGATASSAPAAALVAVDPADVAAVSPAVPVLGGPAGTRAGGSRSTIPMNMSQAVSASPTPMTTQPAVMSFVGSPGTGHAGHDDRPPDDDPALDGWIVSIRQGAPGEKPQEQDHGRISVTPGTSKCGAGMSGMFPSTEKPRPHLRRRGPGVMQAGL